MRILTQNHVFNSTVTATSEAAHYPAENLKHIFRSKSYRSTSTTASVTFDLSTSFNAVNSCVVLWPKETGIKLSNTATVTLEASPVNDFSSPPVSIELTPNNTYMIASHYFSEVQNYRFWRITIQDDLSAYDYVELGTVWLGEAVDMGPCQNGFKFVRQDLSNQTATAFGHVYTDIYPQRLSLSFDFQNLEYEQVQAIDNAYVSVGSNSPVIVVVDESDSVFDRDHLTVYGLFKDSFGLNHIRHDVLNTDNLVVTELS